MTSKIQKFWHFFGHPKYSQKKAVKDLGEKYGDLLSNPSIEGDILRLKYIDYIQAQFGEEEFKKKRKLWNQNRSEMEKLKTAIKIIRKSSLISNQTADSVIATLLVEARCDNPSLDPIFIGQKKLSKGRLKDFKSAQRRKLYERMKGFPF